MEDFLKNTYTDFISSRLNALPIEEVDPSRVGLHANAGMEEFSQRNNLTSEEDKNELRKLTEESTTRFKNENNMTRFIPSNEEMKKYYTPLTFSETDSPEDKISKIDQWKVEALAKAEKIRPADRDDLSTHVNFLGNEMIREEVGKNTGKFGDFGNRLVQGLGETMYSLFDYEGSQDFFSKNFAENPKFDEDFTSQVATGIGDTMTQLLVAAGSGFAAGPEASAAAVTAYNAARMMKTSYMEEMKRSNNTDLALTTAVSQIPSIALESVADNLLIGRVHKMGFSAVTFKEAFKNAATEEAKRALIKDFIPKVGQQALMQGVSEATIGGYASEFTSGYGAYLATGDEKYLKSQDKLVESGLVEGTVGALFGGGIAALQKPGAKNMVSSLAADQTRVSEIQQLLSKGDYQGVVSLLSKPAPAKPTATTPASSSGVPVEPAKSVIDPNISVSLEQMRNYQDYIRRYEGEKDPQKKAAMEPFYTKIKSGLQALSAGGFQGTNEFTADLPLEAISFTKEGENLSRNSVRNTSPYSLTLEDNSDLPGDASFVVYVPPSGVNRQGMNRTQLFNGNVSLAISDGGSRGKLLVQTPDGKVLGRGANNKDFSVSFRPKKGWTPIAVYDSVNEDTGAVNRKIKLLSPVKDFARLKKEDFTYIGSEIDQDGNLLGVRVKTKGGDKFITGLAALEIELQEREKGIESQNNEKEREAIITEEDAEGGPLELTAEEEKADENASEETEQKTEETPKVPALTEKDVFKGLKDMGSIIKTVIPMSKEERFNNYNKYEEKLNAAIVAVEKRLNDLLSRGEGNPFYQELYETYEFLNSLKNPINPVVQNQVDNQEEVDGEPAPEPQDSNFTDSGTLASYDGKEVTWQGIKGTVKIEGNDAILVREDGEYLIGNRNLRVGKFYISSEPLPEVEGLETADSIKAVSVTPMVPIKITEETGTSHKKLKRHARALEAAKEKARRQAEQEEARRNVKRGTRFDSIRATQPELQTQGKAYDVMRALQKRARRREARESKAPVPVAENVAPPPAASVQDELPSTQTINEEPAAPVVNIAPPAVVRPTVTPSAEIKILLTEPKSKLTMKERDLFNWALEGVEGGIADEQLVADSLAEGSDMSKVDGQLDDLRYRLEDQAKDMVENDAKTPQEIAGRLKTINSLLAKLKKEKYFDPSSHQDQPSQDSKVTEEPINEDELTQEQIIAMEEEEQNSRPRVFKTNRALEDTFADMVINDSVSDARLMTFLENLSQEELNHLGQIYETDPIPDSILKANNRNQESMDIFSDNMRISDDDYSYAITEETGQGSLSEQEIKDHLKSVFGNDVDVVTSTELTSNGKEWSGRREKNSGNIQINARNIKSLEDAEKRYREEVFHAAYADSSLRQDMLDIVPKVGQLSQQLQDQGYNPSEVREEEVVKRVNDLIDGWKARSKFDQFVQKLKTWAKQSFGVTLNEKDAQYLASKILNETLKRGLSNNTISEDRYSLAEEEDVNVFDIIAGKVTNSRKDQIKEARKLQRKYIEQKLIIQEPGVYKMLKGIKFQFLSEAATNDYLNLFSNFIETRSLVQNPQNYRVAIEELKTQIADLNKVATQNEFDQLQQDYPEVLDGKDFQADFDGDISLVKDLIAQENNLVDSGNDISEAQENYLARVPELQEMILEEIETDGEAGTTAIDNLFDGMVIEHNNDPALMKANELTQEFMADAKRNYRSFVLALSTLDPSSLTFKELRNLYYSLMSVATDGYPLGSDSFISQEMRNLLNREGIRFTDPFKTKNATIRKNISSFATSLSRLGGKEAADALNNLTTPYRNSLKMAERYEAEVLNPYSKAIQKKLQTALGRKLNNEELIQLGLYSMLRQHYIDEAPKEGLERNIGWVLESISRYSDSNDKNFKDASVWQKQFVDSLVGGIDLSDDAAMASLEARAKEIFGDAKIQYVQDITDLFKTMTPLARFATEFVYGKPFQEINNYVPSFSTLINGSSNAIDMNQVTLSTPVENIANGMIAYQDLKYNRNGMSSIKKRHRVLGKDRALVFNINHLFYNRGRLNALDYFTSIRRRELANIISDKNQEFQDWLGDSNNQRGRAELLRGSIRQTWLNSIQASSFLGDFHRISNALTARMASVKLSSSYQLVAQTLSNSMTYLASNLTRPQRIMDFFKAYSFMVRALNDPEKAPLMGQLLADLRKRSQDATLDKSVSLDVNGKSTWQQLKATKAFSVIEDLDNLRQDIMFAQFKISDYLSGDAIMLAEYLNQEREAGRATDFDNMTYNPNSYFFALDETEKMIGIGAASRRGLWMHNSSASISLIRNLTMMFASHRINNATNFEVALGRLRDTNATPEDKSRAVGLMMGLIAQTATFNLAKAGMLVFLGQGIVGAAMGDEEEGIEELYKKKQQALSKKEKEMIQQEISIRRDIRGAVNQFNERNNSGRVLGLNMSKDLLSNMFIVPALMEFPSDAAFHLMFDKTEEVAFQNFKDKELDRLRILAKNAKTFGNLTENAKILEKISDLESQQSIPIVFEGNGIQTYSGVYGPFLKQNLGFATEAFGALQGTQVLDLKDWAVLAGTYGVGSADLERYLKLREKIIEARIKGETAKKEKLKELDREMFPSF